MIGPLARMLGPLGCALGAAAAAAPPGSPMAWWKADSLALSDGASVTSWGDSSGNGNALASGATAPVFKAAIVNGKPVVRFTPNAEFNVGFTLPNPFTIFFVANTNGLGQFNVGSIMGWGGSLDRIEFCSAGALMIDSNSGFGFTAPTSSFEVRTCVFNGASSSTRKNGAADVSGTTGTSGYPATRVGDDGSGFRHFSGDIAEILIYGAALSLATQQAAENYLNSRYAIF